ncbi:hypothetical protein HA402_014119 [Bradysia odoriphaga]|nr:hypothetical protein HA402_014119 [Bradysia odoriphaga]
MGYEVTRFIGEIDDEFLCTICTMVLEEAIQSPCEHVFCKECIMAWLAADRSCPVDRGALQVVDLKPAPRFFRNLLVKFMIKCDFEQKGCDNVVQLEHLQTHVINCALNPYSEVICDKGCNLKMYRHEYETDNCLTHLSSRLIQKDLEITRLSALTSCLEEENRQMKDKMNRQQEENRQLNDEKYRLRLQIKTCLLKWNRSENVKFSGQSSNILEIDNTNRTVFAQLFYSLESDFFFGVQILDWNKDSWMVIGLTRKHYPSYDPPGWSAESIGYSSYGNIQINSTSEKVGASWQDGDTIHCGMKFCENATNYTSNFKVMFLRNGKRAVEKYVGMPRDGLYPTICMWNTKVKYLTK